MTYLKETFDPQSLKHAKDIVLTPDPVYPKKFEEETKFLTDFIAAYDLITQDSLVLDFGCGMGRVAKKLIEAFECRVVGVDISARMLLFARQYVGDERFIPLLAQSNWVESLSGADLAVAAFVLQHAQDPSAEIAKIARTLKPGGVLIVLDDGKRFVPSAVDARGFVLWEDDGIVVADILTRTFAGGGHFPYLNRKEKILSIWKKI